MTKYILQTIINIEPNIYNLSLTGRQCYNIQVIDTMLFVNKLVGTRGLFTTLSIEDYLKVIIVSKLNTVLGNELKSIFDISKNIIQLNQIFKTELQQEFNTLGLKLHDFYVQSISVPDEVQKMIDTRSGMGALGSLDQYMKFKIATAIGDSANNSNGSGNAFNTGAGLALGMLIPQMMNSSLIQSNASSIDSLDKLKKLKELLELNAITQKEFDDKKTILLKDI